MEDSLELQLKAVQDYIEKGLELSRRAQQKQRFNIGETVRVHIKKTPFMRSYDYQTNLQRYIISAVDKTYKELRYKLKDERNVELKGYFYSHELVGINLSDKYRAKKVGEVTLKGKKYSKIHYIGYPKEFDELHLIKP